MNILDEKLLQKLGIKSARKKHLKGIYAICPHCGESFQTSGELITHQDRQGHVIYQ